MLRVDYFAYRNKLNYANSFEKITLSLGSLLLVLLFKNSWISFLVLIVMSLLIVRVAKIPISYYGKLLLLPLSFLCLGGVSIVLSITAAPSAGVQQAVLLVKLANFHLYFLPGQLEVVLPLIIRSFSSISCLYFLILTTPISQIVSILHRWKVPILLLEIIMLTYRYLFLLLDTAADIYVSQRSRLGYQSISSGLFSGGRLVTSLFIKTYQQAKELQISIDSRGGGTLYDPVYEKKNLSVIHVCFITVFFLVVLLLNFIS
ncbi:cobalt ECF transporter T component CbiQ [Robertmurraya korlensis]|uniref:cobalt ECF transporter T component CbiQ n=1 Tax=Robertmurraya korlensis TaxID=519977 RepID=UPI0008270BD3|nr:cobalt ECF transporter T component CbiQ [Robertmurraya korlensis]